MSGVASAWQLPHDELEEAAREKDSRSNLLDFLLFAMLPITVGVPGLRIPLPEAAGVAIVVLAFLRRTSLPRHRPIVVELALFAFMAVVLWSAFVNSITPIKRIGHLGLYCLLILVISSGRVQRLAAVRGLAFGTALVLASAFLNLVIPIWPSAYEGRLTGVAGDPNALGFYITTLGCLAFTGLRPGLPRLLGVGIAGVTIVLTYSRTSIVVLVVVAAWLLIRRIHRPSLALPLFAVVVYVVQQLGERLQTWGPFASRVGSDQLRDRIEMAERFLLAQDPWFGNGPGTSMVTIGDNQFFFHSSWLGLRNEVGWLGTLVFVLLVSVAAFMLLRLPTDKSHPWYEGAIIAALLCAVNLGEVLLELNTAMVIGLAIRHALAPDELRIADGDKSSNHVLW